MLVNFQEQMIFRELALSTGHQLRTEDKRGIEALWAMRRTHGEHFHANDDKVLVSFAEQEFTFGEPN